MTRSGQAFRQMSSLLSRSSYICWDCSLNTAYIHNNKHGAGPAVAVDSAVPSASTTAAAAAEDAKSTTGHVLKELRSRAYTSYIARIISLYIWKTKKQHLRPSKSRLPNTRPTELLVRGATTPITTAGPARPPVSTAGLTLSLAACPRDTALTVGVRATCNSLRPRLPTQKANVMV